MYDNINGAVLSLLQERNILCKEYEATMESLISCEDEQLTPKIDQLDELSEGIDDINRQINLLVSEDRENGIMIKSAVYNRGSRADLPESLQEVYDIAAEGFMYLNRARNASSIVNERLINSRQEINKRIRSMSVKPKIITYLNSGVPSVPAGGKIDNSI